MIPWFTSRWNGSGVERYPKIEKNLVPEPRVEEVKDGVLSSADIEVYAAANLVREADRASRHPVGFGLLSDEARGVSGSQKRR